MFSPSYQEALRHRADPRAGEGHTGQRWELLALAGDGTSGVRTFRGERERDIYIYIECIYI